MIINHNTTATTITIIPTLIFFSLHIILLITILFKVKINRKYDALSENLQKVINQLIGEMLTLRIEFQYVQTFHNLSTPLIKIINISQLI